MAKKVLEFPFLRGQDEGADPKLLASVAPQGTLKRAVNVRLRKDGRLGSRRDYDAFSMGTRQSSSLVATDVVNFDGKLVAFGDSQNPNKGFPIDAYSYLGTAFGANPWQNGAGLDPRLSMASALRDLARLPAMESSMTNIDVAACQGCVCTVYTAPGGVSYIHIVQAATGNVLFSSRSTAGSQRVVATSDRFLIGIVNTARTLIDLYEYIPGTSGVAVFLSTPFTAIGSTIEAWDMTLNVALTELIMCEARATPTSQIKRVNTAGTVLQTIAGPATLLDFATVYNDGTRIHFVQVNDTTRIIRLTTYLVAGGATENGPTTLFASGTTLQQAAIGFRTSALIRVTAQIDAAATSTTDVISENVTASTHVIGADTTWRNVKLSTKTFHRALSGSTTFDVYFGGTFTDDDKTNFLGALDSEQVMAAKEHEASFSPPAFLGHLARDASTGKMYWPQLVLQDESLSDLAVGVATEFSLCSGERFQTASIGGKLYCALGQMAVFDGTCVVESCFPDRPTILASTQVAAGSLTVLSTYTLAAVWEWTDSNGDVHESPVSEFEVVTLTGGNQRVQLIVSTPHSVRRTTFNTATHGTAVAVVVYCSTANGSALHRASRQFATTAAVFGATLTFNIDGPDATLAAAEAIYIQGPRPLPVEVALPCRYVWANKDRLLNGGQPKGSQLQESTPLFPGEPVNWSLDIAFFTAIRGDNTSVFVLDDRRIATSASEIFVVPGEGLDDDGNGSFGPSQKLPSDGGCIDWRSVVECSLGIFFQLDTDKIYILPRGGGSPMWIGQPIRDTLAAFPVITSATLVEADQTVCFTCNDAAVSPTTGRILIYDIRAQTWFVDEPISAETYRSSCAYQNRLMLCKGTGAIFQQKTSDTPATFIPVELETPDIYPGGQDGWAEIFGASLLAEFRGNCILTCDYSLDCGVTYVTGGRSYSLSGLTVGSRVRKTWTFGVAGPITAESIRLRFRTAALAGAATAGLVWNSYGIKAEPKTGFARLAAADQG